MKKYAVYATDTDGSERKVATVEAKSSGHAITIARKICAFKLVLPKAEIVE